MKSKIEWRRLALSALDVTYLSVAIAWFLALTSWFAQIVVGREFIATIGKNPYFFLDYVKYYVFTAITFSKDSHLVYDPHVQWEWTEKVLHPSHLHQLLYSEYPPFTGLLLAPLHAFSIDWGFVVWLSFLLISAFLPAIWLGKTMRGQKPLTWLGICAAVFASVCGEWATLLGQLNWSMLGMISLLFISLVRNNWWLGAVAMAFISLKPQYAVFFVFILLGAARWRTLLLLCAIELVLFLAAGVFIGFENVFGYPNVIFQVDMKGEYGGVKFAEFARDAQFTVSAKRLFDAFAPANIAVALSAPLYFVAALFSGWCWRLATRVQSREAMSWAMAASVLLYLITSPHCHLHDCVSLGAAAMATLSFCGLHKLSSLPQIRQRLWLVILYLYTPLSWVVFFSTPSESLWRTLYFLGMNVALLIIALSMLRSALRQPQAEPS